MSLIISKSFRSKYIFCILFTFFKIKFRNKILIKIIIIKFNNLLLSLIRNGLTVVVVVVIISGQQIVRNFLLQTCGIFFVIEYRTNFSLQLRSGVHSPFRPEDSSTHGSDFKY